MFLISRHKQDIYKNYRRLFLFCCLIVLNLFFFQPAFAQRNTTCPTKGEGRNCSLEGSSLYYCGRTCRTLPGEPGEAWTLNCNTCQWTCPAPNVVCGNQCQISRAGRTCNFPDAANTNDGTEDACGNCIFCNTAIGYIDCRANSKGCITQSESDIIKNQTSCSPGTQPNQCGVCQLGAYTPVYLNYYGVQSGSIDVLGNIKTGGDLYFANGKAIRVDGSGTTLLNIGNWGQSGSSTNVVIWGNLFVGHENGPSNLKVSGTISEEGQLLRDRYQIKGQEADPLYSTWYNGGSPTVSNLVVNGAIQGNFVAFDGTECGAGYILKKSTDPRLNIGSVVPWVCAVDETGIGGVGVETDPVFTPWYSNGSPSLTALTVIGSIKEGNSLLSAKYAASAHNHDISYLKLTGGTLTNKLTINAGGLDVMGGISLGTPEGNVGNVNAIIGYDDLFLKGKSDETAPVYVGASQFKVYTSNTERLNVDSSGDVNVFKNLKVTGCFGPMVQTKTNATFQGNMGSATDNGYKKADSLCNDKLSGSHQCSTVEVLNSIHCGYIWTDATKSTLKGSILPAGFVWITNGAPSLPTPTNDCYGWSQTGVVSGQQSQGIAWYFNVKGGGGYARACTNSYNLLCCK